jgi:hypothetical protein
VYHLIVFLNSIGFDCIAGLITLVGPKAHVPGPTPDLSRPSATPATADAHAPIAARRGAPRRRARLRGASGAGARPRRGARRAPTVTTLRRPAHGRHGDDDGARRRSSRGWRLHGMASAMATRPTRSTLMQLGHLRRARRSPGAIRIDTLTAVMLVVVNTVSALVHIYSIGYMHEDPHRPRFFAYLSLFTFAMLMLVTADNFLQLFFGWEGVGLASYL